MSLYPQRTFEAIRYGERMAEARRECEWSQDELAIRADVKYADVWQFEKGYDIDQAARDRIISTLNQEFDE